MKGSFVIYCLMMIWCTGSSEGGSSGNVGLPATRGFDVNRTPAAGGEEVSSPNSVASSFQMDFGIFRRGNNKRDSAGNDVGEGGERASSRASDEDENALARKKLRLSKEQSAFLEESFKEHNTLNPVSQINLNTQFKIYLYLFMSYVSVCVCLFFFLPDCCKYYK